MTLTLIKTESLIKELLNRCSDQLHDPEPQFDSVLSFLTQDEIDDLIGSLGDTLSKQKLRVRYGR